MMILSQKPTITLSKHLCRLSSISVKSTGYKNKELVLNPKYGDKTSDPLYTSLVYSSEVDVALTVRRGKAWLEMVAMKKCQAENEKKARERAAQARPVPLALQYLYGSSGKVQREDDVTEDISIDVEGINIFEDNTDLNHRGESDFKLPYGVHTSLDGDIISEGTIKDRKESGRGRRKIRHSSEGSNIDYDVIEDNLNKENVRELFTEDHLFKFGTADIHIPSTNFPCGGCGAHLHCIDEKIPGFVPSQLMKDRPQEEIRSLLCQRCYIIKEYKVALKVNVSPEDYPRAIEHIKDKQALILLTVDLLDFPGSVWPGILDLLGTNKKVILVGNKFDLLLPDSSKYQARITNLIRKEFLEKCWQSSREGRGGETTFPQLIGSVCVSAVTGFNIEKLIEMIFDCWKTNFSSLPGDIYIVGCTNVGKSSLFNILLDSDLCKVKALDLIQKAMISPVPGTTLNLLKFPISRPEPHFLSHRRHRVRQADVEFFKQEQIRLENLENHKQVRYAVPSNYNIKHTLQNKTVDTEGSYLNQIDTNGVDGVKLPERIDHSDEEFVLSKYCHDTPGTVNEDQIINLLTAEEISRTLSTIPIRPRTLLLRPGETLLLGALGRLDLLSKSNSSNPEHPVMITVFCSDRLPINIVQTSGVDQFLQLGADRGLIGVPGNSERLDQIPTLLGKQIVVDGISFEEGSTDIVLSSSGWVMITPRHSETCTFIGYTPGGKGIETRLPYLPFSIHQRGRRVSGTSKYKNDRLFIG